MQNICTEQHEHVKTDGSPDAGAQCKHSLTTDTEAIHEVCCNDDVVGTVTSVVTVVHEESASQLTIADFETVNAGTCDDAAEQLPDERKFYSGDRDCSCHSNQDKETPAQPAMCCHWLCDPAVLGRDRQLEELEAGTEIETAEPAHDSRLTWVNSFLMNAHSTLP